MITLFCYVDMILISLTVMRLIHKVIQIAKNYGS